MKRRFLMASFCFFWLFLISWQSALCPQEKPRKDPLDLLVGNWTEIIRDGGMEGIRCMVVERKPRIVQPKKPTTIRWKITKETIEVGEDVEGCFPQKRYTYKLNPGGQADAIDLSLDEVDLDIANKAKRKKLDAKEKKAQQGIYFVVDDYLFICIGQNSRPKSLTTYEKDNPATIVVLRRGRLRKGDNKDSGDSKRKKK